MNGPSTVATKPRVWPSSSLPRIAFASSIPFWILALAGLAASSRRQSTKASSNPLASPQAAAPSQTCLPSSIVPAWRSQKSFCAGDSTRKFSFIACQDLFEVGVVAQRLPPGAPVGLGVVGILAQQRGVDLIRRGLPEDGVLVEAALLRLLQEDPQSLGAGRVQPRAPVRPPVVAGGSLGLHGPTAAAPPGASETGPLVTAAGHHEHDDHDRGHGAAADAEVERQALRLRGRRVLRGGAPVPHARRHVRLLFLGLALERGPGLLERALGDHGLADDEDRAAVRAGELGSLLQARYVEHRAATAAFLASHGWGDSYFFRA